MRTFLIVAFVLCLFVQTASFAKSKGPRVFILDPAALVKSKQRVQAKDPVLMPIYEALIAQADSSMQAGPYTVTDKQQLPSSADRHDYYSLAIYWWPNPDTADGLPYVRRDGQVNPEISNFDGGKIAAMASNIYTLALAYYFSGDQKYAERCSMLLKTWFIDPETRMNPHLRFAQHIPGRVSEGNYSGIIDTVVVSQNIIDSVGLLSGSKAWTAKNQKAMQKWFSEYLDWLLTSKQGKQEASQSTNHGFWYDCQVMSYAMFTGKTSIAQDTCNKVTKKRIGKQIMADGSQVAELLRTKAFDYSLYNLDAMFCVASMADKLGIDLWNYKAEQGQSIRTALDYLLPYADGSVPWPYSQITGFHPESLFSYLRRAARAYKYPDYELLIQKLPAPEQRTASLTNLLYPAEAVQK